MKDNPMHYCITCNKYIGHRGFCSGKCHDEYYTKDNDALDGLFALSDKIPKNFSNKEEYIKWLEEQ